MKKYVETNDQPAILLEHCRLLSKLDASSMLPLGDDGKVKADLIPDDGVSDILGKFTHNTRVCFIFLVTICTRLLQNAVQLVLDPFEGSVTMLVSGR